MKSLMTLLEGGLWASPNWITIIHSPVDALSRDTRGLEYNTRIFGDDVTVGEDEGEI